jgi:transcriptional antiterminator RfaH
MASLNEDSLIWYVVHTHPKQEERAGDNLVSFGIETLAPKLKVKKYNEFTGKPSQIVKPFFPGYIFARFKFSELYHKIKFTRGVHSLVCFCNKPIPVEDEIIEVVRQRIGSDGFMKEFEQLQPGDEVVINDGRFRDFYGVFERELPDADRVRILLNTVSFQAHIVVDRPSVNKVSAEKRSSAQSNLAYSF